MEFQRIVIAVSVFAIVAVGALAMFQVADLGQRAAPAENRTAVNESIPQEYDAYQFVDNATEQFFAGGTENVTVYNNSSVKLEKGIDYEWNATDATIKFNDTPKTNESNPANVTYTYQYNVQRVREVSGPLSSLTEAVGLMPLFAGGVGLVVVLIVMGGFIAKRVGKASMPRSNR